MGHKKEFGKCGHSHDPDDLVRDAGQIGEFVVESAFPAFIRAVSKENRFKKVCGSARFDGLMGGIGYAVSEMMCAVSGGDDTLLQEIRGRFIAQMDDQIDQYKAGRAESRMSPKYDA